MCAGLGLLRCWQGGNFRTVAAGVGYSAPSTSGTGESVHVVVRSGIGVVRGFVGALKFRQIADHAADPSGDVLENLGGPWCWFRGRIRFPGVSTIRRALAAIDADKLDEFAGQWLWKYAPRSSDRLILLTLDGKVSRGVRTQDVENFTLFSAMLQAEGVIIAQVGVPAGTNETTQVTTILEPVKPGGEQRVVVTAEAPVTVHERGAEIMGEFGGDGEHFLVQLIV